MNDYNINVTAQELQEVIKEKYPYNTVRVYYYLNMLCVDYKPVGNVFALWFRYDTRANDIIIFEEVLDFEDLLFIVWIVETFKKLNNKQD